MHRKPRHSTEPIPSTSGSTMSRRELLRGVGGLGLLSLVGCAPTTPPAEAQRAPQTPPEPTESLDNKETEQIPSLPASELPWGGMHSGGINSREDFPFIDPDTGESMTLAEIADKYDFSTEKYPTMKEANAAFIEMLNDLMRAGTSRAEINAHPNLTFTDKDKLYGAYGHAANFVYVEVGLTQAFGKPWGELPTTVRGESSEDGSLGQYMKHQTTKFIQATSATNIKEYPDPKNRAYEGSFIVSSSEARNTTVTTKMNFKDNSAKMPWIDTSDLKPGSAGVNDAFTLNLDWLEIEGRWVARNFNLSGASIN